MSGLQVAMVVLVVLAVAALYLWSAFADRRRGKEIERDLRRPPRPGER